MLLAWAVVSNHVTVHVRIFKWWLCEVVFRHVWCSFFCSCKNRYGQKVVGMSQRNGFRNQGRGNKRTWKERQDKSGTPGSGQGDSFREREPREDSKEGIKVEVDSASTNTASNDNKNESFNADATNATPTGKKEKKFGNRSRLYVGNLPRNTTEEDLKVLFEPYGEASQFYIEKEKNFGFVRMVRRPIINLWVGGWGGCYSHELLDIK